MPVSISTLVLLLGRLYGSRGSIFVLFSLWEPGSQAFWMFGWYSGSVYRGSLFSGWLVLGRMFPSTRLLCFAKVCSKESVPFAGACKVLLVSSLYHKLVLLFLIYIILIFDKKKRALKKKELSAARERCSPSF